MHLMLFDVVASARIMNVQKTGAFAGRIHFNLFRKMDNLLMNQMNAIREWNHISIYLENFIATLSIQLQGGVCFTNKSVSKT